MSTYKNIIFIDDDEDDRMIFGDILHRVYPNIIYNDFSNADEFFAFVSSDVIMQPDLIFLDLNMPMKDGFYVLKMLKKREDLKDVPVVILSTSKHPQDIEKAKKLGAVAYAVKPNELSSLIDIIQMTSQNLLYSPYQNDDLVLLDSKFAS